MKCVLSWEPKRRRKVPRDSRSAVFSFPIGISAAFPATGARHRTLVAPISRPNAILIMMAETAEEISKKPEIRKELQRTTGEKRPDKVKARGRDKFWFVAHALVLAGCIAAYFLLGSKLIPLAQPTVALIGRILRGAALIVIVLAI